MKVGKHGGLRKTCVSNCQTGFWTSPKWQNMGGFSCRRDLKRPFFLIVFGKHGRTIHDCKAHWTEQCYIWIGKTTHFRLLNSDGTICKGPWWMCLVNQSDWPETSQLKKSHFFLFARRKPMAFWTLSLVALLCHGEAADGVTAVQCQNRSIQSFGGLGVWINFNALNIIFHII